MLVKVKNIHLMKHNVVYLSNEANNMMVGAFVCQGVIVKEGKQILLLQPMGLKNNCEFDLEEVIDNLYYNDYRDIDDDYNEVDTQDEFWLGAI